MSSFKNLYKYVILVAKLDNELSGGRGAKYENIFQRGHK